PVEAAVEAATDAGDAAAVLSTKGAASAAGFRPEYWFYERPQDAAAAEAPRGVVTPFISSQARSVAETTPESTPEPQRAPEAKMAEPTPAAPMAAEPAVSARGRAEGEPQRRAAASSNAFTNPIVLFGCFAIVLSVIFLLLSGPQRGEIAS